MQYLFSQAEDRFQLRDWGGYLCFLATADSAAARKFGVTAIVRMDKLIHDPHVHDDSDEIFYVLRGHGKQLLRNPDGTDTVYDIAPGDTVYLTKNRWHGTSNFSDSEQLDMLLINYFYDGQSDPDIRGVVPAGSVPCEQTAFGSRERVLTPERCGTEHVRGGADDPAWEDTGREGRGGGAVFLRRFRRGGVCRAGGPSRGGDTAVPVPGRQISDRKPGRAAGAALLPQRGRCAELNTEETTQ